VLALSVLAPTVPAVLGGPAPAFTPAAAANTARVRYRPPVAAPVVDPWRPPSTPYGPGNRGVDYGTAPGDPVVAPADGVVTFAGAVASTRYVVIVHADGIRTTLGGLATIAVRSGEPVVAGQVVGTAGGPLHFGARRAGRYIDPLGLVRRRPARLVARTG
jgi:murein DD-endopeptidase MepM/ murein hydrolase activator NlpD